MKVLFLGKKQAGCECLQYLLDCGVSVTAVVAPEQDALRSLAQSHGLALATSRELSFTMQSKSHEHTELQAALEDIDVVFSFMFWERIRKPLIDLPRLGVINFHGAPLPDFRGCGAYNVAIIEGVDRWGVSSHWITDENFDTGPLIFTRQFDIDHEQETAYSLEQRSHAELVSVFRQIVRSLLDARPLPRIEQHGQGRYISRKEYLKLRRVTLDMTPQDIERRIRAFWYPPWPGATLEVNGVEYTLVNDFILREAKKFYQGHAGPVGTRMSRGAIQ